MAVVVRMGRLGWHGGAARRRRRGSDCVQGKDASPQPKAALACDVACDVRVKRCGRGPFRKLQMPYFRRFQILKLSQHAKIMATFWLIAANSFFALVSVHSECEECILIKFRPFPSSGNTLRAHIGIPS